MREVAQSGDWECAMIRAPRILIFTSSSSPYAPLILEPVAHKYRDRIAAVVTVGEADVWRKFRKVLRVIQNAGWRYTLLKLFFLACLRIHQLMGKYSSLSKVCERYDLRHVALSSLRTDDAVTLLTESRADVLLSILFEKIFPTKILELPPVAALNFHPAPLPRYAGIAPTFWVLSNDEKKTAVTIHYLNEGIDTGDIFLQTEVPIDRRESVHSLYLKCCRQGADLICEGIERIAGGDFPRIHQRMDERTYFVAPSKAGYRLLRKNYHSLFTLRELLFPK